MWIVLCGKFAMGRNCNFFNITDDEHVLLDPRGIVFATISGARHRLLQTDEGLCIARAESGKFAVVIQADTQRLALASAEALPRALSLWSGPPAVAGRRCSAGPSTIAVSTRWPVRGPRWRDSMRDRVGSPRFPYSPAPFHAVAGGPARVCAEVIRLDRAGLSPQDRFDTWHPAQRTPALRRLDHGLCRYGGHGKGRLQGPHRLERHQER